MMKRLIHRWMIQQSDPNLIVAASLLVLGLLFMGLGWWG